jgi:hypothetical protein
MGSFPNKAAASGHSEVKERSRVLKLLPNTIPGSKKTPKAKSFQKYVINLGIKIVPKLEYSFLQDWYPRIPKEGPKLTAWDVLCLLWRQRWQRFIWFHTLYILA